MHLQGYCMPLVQYFYISAQDDAGTAGGGRTSFNIAGNITGNIASNNAE